MPDPILMTKAAVFAAIVAVIVALLLGRLRLTGGAVGVGLGILAGAWTLGRAPGVPAREALDRFLLVLIPAAVLAEVAAASRARLVGWTMRLVVAALATPIPIHGSSYITDLSDPASREWTPSLTAAICAGLGTALFLAWALLTSLATQAGHRVVRVARHRRPGTTGGRAVNE